MPFLLHRPTESAVRQHLSERAGLELSYGAVGWTRAGLMTARPRFHQVDRARAVLGVGRAAFAAACGGLERWQQFDMPWITHFWPSVAIAVGGQVAIGARALGFWSINACRIVYVIDERATASGQVRFGYAYGTLPGHVESGEERFLIEWDRDGDDTVSYDLLALSRPRHPLAIAGYPYTRLLQRRFRAASLRAMCRAAAGESRLAHVPGSATRHYP